MQAGCTGPKNRTWTWGIGLITGSTCSRRSRQTPSTQVPVAHGEAAEQTGRQTKSAPEQTNPGGQFPTGDDGSQGTGGVGRCDAANAATIRWIACGVGIWIPG